MLGASDDASISWRCADAATCSAPRHGRRRAGPAAAVSGSTATRAALAVTGRSAPRLREGYAVAAGALLGTLTDLSARPLGEVAGAFPGSVTT